MRRNRIRLIAVVALAAIAVVALTLPLVAADGPTTESQTREFSSVAELSAMADAHALRAQLARADVDLPFADFVLAGTDADQAVFDDLVVEGGEVIEGGVVVYDGDARVKGGGRIDGDLVVYSGDIRIDSGGKVNGDVSTFSGDIRVSGAVDGNLTTWSGDVNLRDGASVGGDVSVLNGDVKRSSGASVGGNIVRGPRLEIPSMPAAPLKFGDPRAAGVNSVAAAGPSALQKFASFILRLMGMAMLSLLVGVVAWLIAQIRPSTIRRTQVTMAEQPALSFVVGILANVVLLLAGLVFAITVCLIPITLVSYLLLIGLNVLGWAALAHTVGQRVTTRYELTMRWDYAMAIAAAVMAITLGLFWAMGGCFRFFGFAGMLVISSIGAGAVLLPYVNRFLHPPAQLPESSSASRDIQPIGEDSEIAQSGAEDSTIREDVEVSAMATLDEEVQVDDASPIAEVVQDDFLKLRGIGPVAVDRLTAAGITSYTALTGLSPEQLGEILRWSPDRVRQSGIIDQAAQLAAGND